ncbi:imidazolonepropionase [Endozoicomonas sp. OPT23]|uniref:imidazolonepropionase n=1 Tax=Endozoicomonas sp. OPT23 TaxID=2072845 RepID=UPI00189173D8|nr:imidazolonepropionase [Endozoicomonas sp. OPT23]
MTTSTALKKEASKEDSHAQPRYELLISNVHLATMNPEQKLEDNRYGVITDGAVVVDQGEIIWTGKQTDLPESFQFKRRLNGHNYWLTPGLIDPHTHLVYAGDRSQEFEQRLEGVSYETIAKQGGGILSTVKATHSASVEELVSLARPRLEALINEGVTAVEIKSGYGLDLESELKILRAIDLLAEQYPVDIQRTFLGAHALPPDYKDRADDYIDLVCEQMLPVVAKEKLADAVDVFCEKIAFNLEQTEKVFRKARELGLAVKLHAEQLSDSGGSELAASYSALSVDHLEYLSEQGIASLKNRATVATLLPGAFYYLRETKLPPVDALKKAGVPIALATDLNPGTSPLASLRLMMNMGCTLFGLTPSESLAGVTRNAAKALGMQQQLGMIKTGMKASLALWPVSHPSALTANMAGNNPVLVMANGQIIKSDLPMEAETLWQGRVDQEEHQELALRWHQQVQPYTENTSQGGVALIGFASDEGVRRNKGRPGAAKSPNLIRKALAPLPWNRKQPAWDAGNINCVGLDLETAYRDYANRITELLDSGCLPAGLGGGHEIAWGSFLGLANSAAKTVTDNRDIKIGIINFDAHFDLRQPEQGPSSGTPFWQIHQHCQQTGIPFHYFCLGVSDCSNTEALFKRANDLGVIYHTDREMTYERMEQIREELGCYIDQMDHIYLTIDLDVFPASQAPGVSAPASRGVGIEIIEPLLELIRNSGKISLVDIAEYNPNHDIDQRTAKLAARLMHLLSSEAAIKE